jgi:hypothetical protein
VRAVQWKPAGGPSQAAWNDVASKYCNVGPNLELSAGLSSVLGDTSTWLVRGFACSVRESLGTRLGGHGAGPTKDDQTEPSLSEERPGVVRGGSYTWPTAR